MPYRVTLRTPQCLIVGCCREVAAKYIAATGPKRSRRWVSVCHISDVERETRGSSFANNTRRTWSLMLVWAVRAGRDYSTTDAD